MFNTSSYVQALYEISVEKKTTEIYYKNSKVLLELIKINPKLINFLSDNQVKLEEKKDLVNKIIKDTTYRKFLYVLIETEKIIGLKMVLKKFINRINKIKGIVEGIIYTTDLLDVDSIKKIEKVMSKKLDKNVQLLNISDKKIIGGIKIDIDGQVWDSTLENQIKKLAKELINKKGEK